MKLGEWAAVAEIIGGAAIIASLIFVGAEVRQNTAAIRSATVQAIADQSNASNLAFATDEKLADLLFLTLKDSEAHKDPSKITGGDKIRLEMILRSTLRRVENIYLHVEGGVLEPEALDRVGYGFYRTDFAKDYWRAARAGFDQDFAKFMDEKVNE
ncbi:hypothetical protein R0135_10130 [Congregibacter variabilis]|uniref:Uncharacterized protein n=1 Tax=Congregibacter variabilis TaxID=3081200 RepID=A0ABZ0I0Q3_9GAMM|nr:hypothetical protein R0135_10130 [Congregibacter sp. IMCC43200]